jgi:hypothetical protein
MHNGMNAYHRVVKDWRKVNVKSESAVEIRMTYGGEWMSGNYAAIQKRFDYKKIG